MLMLQRDPKSLDRKSGHPQVNYGKYLVCCRFRSRGPVGDERLFGGRWIAPKEMASPYSSDRLLFQCRIYSCGTPVYEGAEDVIGFHFPCAIACNQDDIILLVSNVLFGSSCDSPRYFHTNNPPDNL